MGIFLGDIPSYIYWPILRLGFFILFTQKTFYEAIFTKAEWPVEKPHSAFTCPDNGLFHSMPQIR